MNFAATSRMHPRDMEVPPSRRRTPRPRTLRGSAAPARRWLARALLMTAAVLGLQAAWLPAKAALAQGLLETSWRQSLADGGAHRPWPWADTHAVAKLAAPRLGISQVGQAVAQLDDMTQQNAAMVEQSSAAASSMSDQSRRLLDAIKVFSV